METGNVRGISVLNPIGQAIEKTKQILFDPFNLEKWFVIGFCAWLAALGSGGGGGGANFHFNFPSDSPSCSQNINQISHEIKNVLPHALPWLIPVAIIGLFFALAIGLLVIWLKSRAQFMFLDCVVHNRGAVSAPWTIYKNEGNSLFGFNFILWLASFALTLAAVVPLIVIFITFAQTDFKVIMAGPMVGAGFLILGLFLMWMAYSLVTALTNDFVVPVMYLRRCGVMAAWKEFLDLLSTNLGRFILYLLVILATGIVLGLVTTMIVFGVCCCFCCVSWMFLIPLVGSYLFTVLILPLRVWRRSYAVLFLAQFGAAYNVFATAQEPAPPVSEIIEIEPIEPTDPDGSQNPPVS